MRKTLLVTLIGLSLASLVGHAEDVTDANTIKAVPVATTKVTTVTIDDKANIPAGSDVEDAPIKEQAVYTVTPDNIQYLEKSNKQPIIKITNVLIKTDGFYRVERKQQGLFIVVQDFYTSGEKRTDPYAVTDKEKIKTAHFTNVDYDEIGINGLFISWYKDGQIEQKGVYDQGMRKGLWVIWYESGQKKSAGRYRNGLKDGQWTAWYQNGKRMQKGIYREGKREGVWILWYGNGRKKEAGRYSDDKKVERWSYWSESGKMVKDNIMDEDINY